jgi:hypothetical protein
MNLILTLDSSHEITEIGSDNFAKEFITLHNCMHVNP